jgi:hypothetical protein
MSSIEKSPISFRIELDNFRDSSREIVETRQRVEDLDPTWMKLAEEKFGENCENREKIVKQFREKIRDENLEDSIKMLLGEE